MEATTHYREESRYNRVTGMPGMRIIRFNAPLLFTNVERFKRVVHRSAEQTDFDAATDDEAAANGSTRDVEVSEQTASPYCKIDPSQDEVVFELFSNTDILVNAKILNLTSPTAFFLDKYNYEMQLDVNILPALLVCFQKKALGRQTRIKHMIIDCAGLSYTDSMGAAAMKEVQSNDTGESNTINNEI
jgi:hypothetical protein